MGQHAGPVHFGMTVLGRVLGSIQRVGDASAGCVVGTLRGLNGVSIDVIEVD